jgi:hypothetical protein
MDIRLRSYVWLLLGREAGIRIVRAVMTVEADKRLPENEKIRRTMWNARGSKAAKCLGCDGRTGSFSPIAYCGSGTSHFGFSRYFGCSSA